MKFAFRYRLRVAERRLDRKCVALPRKKETFSLAEAREIGIVFEASPTVNLEDIKQFVQQLEEMQAKVFVIGYLDDIKKIDENALMRTGFNYFTGKNLTFFLKPVSPFIEDFLNRKFDILFDLNLENSFPLRYIASLSKAGMKVGKYDDHCDYLDFMIKTETKPSMAYLIEQSMFYLNMIRKPVNV